MRSERIVFVLALVALAAQACDTWTELDEVPCPPGGTDLAWDNFAHGFFAAYCQSCHAASADDRKGAPIAFVFDTYDQAFSLRERVFLRAAAENTTMPPGPDDPPEEAREMLAEWIACGAPAEAPIETNE